MSSVEDSINAWANFASVFWTSQEYGKNTGVTSTITTCTDNKDLFFIQMPRLFDKNDFIPKQVIFNPPCTVVYWRDGTKTIVRCAKNETFVEEYGFAAAVLKKLYGTRADYLRIVENAYRQPQYDKKKKTE